MNTTFEIDRSGEIVGVLKQMNDTFTDNLATARSAEAKALATSSSISKISAAVERTCYLCRLVVLAILAIRRYLLS